jgi:hypothetical protein
MGWLLCIQMPVPLSTNVDSGLLSLTIDSADFYCKRENPIAQSQHGAPFVDCLLDVFSPKAQAVSSESLSKHIFFFSTKKRKESKRQSEH